jgi:Flp pilus assembly protein TadG
VLLEFALVAVVLLMMLFGIIDFARALYTYHFVANAAREGARYAIVRGANCNALLPGCPANAGNIQTYVEGLASGIGIDPNSLVVNPTWPSLTPNPAVATCTANATTGLSDNPGCIVQVQVQYPFNFILPLLPKTTCPIGNTTASICMTSTSQMVISQ